MLFFSGFGGPARGEGVAPTPTFRDGGDQGLVDLFLNLGMTGNHLLNRFVQDGPEFDLGGEVSRVSGGEVYYPGALARTVRCGVLLGWCC